MQAGVVGFFGLLVGSRGQKHFLVVGGVDVALQQLVELLLAIENMRIILEQAFPGVIKNRNRYWIELGPEYFH